MLQGLREVVDEGRARYGNDNLLRASRNQLRNPAGFIPPHAQQAMANAAQALEFTDAGDVKAYQDTTRAALDAIARGSWADAAMNAPNALASLGALLMPGVSARMLQDAPTMVRGMADTIGGAYPGSPTERGMFAGIGAKNADMNALNEAAKMEAAGVAPSDIWQKTGWGRGADNKWRFEIDDSAAQMTDWRKDLHGQSNIAWGGRKGLPTAMPADKWIDHPKLDAAYWSRSEDAPGVFYDDLSEKNGTRGNFDGNTNLVTMDNRTVLDADKGKSVALHELQHSVQKKEGFAMGGSARAPYEPGERMDYIEREYNELRKLNAYDPTNPYSLKDPQLSDSELYKMAVRNVDTAEGREKFYRRLAGEVEARNTQTRMDWDATKRRDVPPWYSEDVPRSQQIVRKRNQ
jgi:hypothetical protein